MPENSEEIKLYVNLKVNLLLMYQILPTSYIITRTYLSTYYQLNKGCFCCTRTDAQYKFRR